MANSSPVSSGSVCYRVCTDAHQVLSTTSIGDLLFLQLLVLPWKWELKIQVRVKNTKCSSSQCLPISCDFQGRWRCPPPPLSWPNLNEAMAEFNYRLDITFLSVNSGGWWHWLREPMREVTSRPMAWVSMRYSSQTIRLYVYRAYRPLGCMLKLSDARYLNWLGLRTRREPIKLENYF